MSIPVLAFVVPCFNEEDVIDKMLNELHSKLLMLIEKHLISSKSFIYVVDDGSKDNTWSIIEKKHKENSYVKGLKLAGNVGHQRALLAGMLYVSGKSDCLISLDADLQDDTSIIEEMLHKYHEGNDIVYGVRRERKDDTYFKKNTALLFYRIMEIMKVKIVYNHADFRLISRLVVESLDQFREVNLFLRAIFPWMGFKSTKVYYERKKREAGKSKYPLKKMLSFAWEGITSFTVMPLRYITALGFVSLLIAVVLSIWTIIVTFKGDVVPGWASTVLPIYFFGSIQLLSLGVLGEYIAKIYKEVKARPRFIKEIELF